MVQFIPLKFLGILLSSDLNIGVIVKRSAEVKGFYPAIETGVGLCPQSIGVKRLSLDCIMTYSKFSDPLIQRVATLL
jgi:hypothetical protein